MGFLMTDTHLCEILRIILWAPWAYRLPPENITHNKMPGFGLNVSIMPINVSVIYSLAERKSSPSLFKYLNATAWRMHEMTTRKMTQKGLHVNGKKAYRQMLTKKKSWDHNFSYRQGLFCFVPVLFIYFFLESESVKKKKR